MTIENLVTLQGPLVEAFSHLDPNTIQHSAEITRERHTNRELRNQWLWTADGAVYTVEKDTCQHCGEQTNKEPTLYLTKGKDNPVFKNITEATEQLRKTQNYIPNKEDLEAAVNSETTLKVKLADLKLQSDNGEWSYFEFDTKNYKKKSNAAQKAVIERVFSEEGVKVLRDNGIKRTRIYTLTPSYVKKHTPKDGAIARACGLGSFGVDSGFGAVGWDVGGSGGRLRGVLRKEVAVGDARKISPELENVRTALDSGDAFRYNGTLYVPTADGIKIPK